MKDAPERPSLGAENSRERKLIGNAVRLAKPLLQDSHLLDESFLIDESDVKKTEQVLQAVFPVDVNNYAVHAHLQLAAKFGRILASRVNLNPSEIQVLLLGHDVGRFITQRWLRNELVAGNIFHQLGIRKDLLGKAPTIDPHPHKEITAKAIEDAFNKMTDEQRVVTIADICGKRKLDDWGIRKFDEVMEYHKSQRGLERKKSMENKSFTFPSERRLTQEKIEFDALLYERIKEWLSEKGVSVDDVRQTILEEEENSPIKAVIFDVGDVLIPNPDPVIIDVFSKAWDEPNQKIAEALTQASMPYQTSNIGGDEFWKRFSSELNKALPAQYKRLLVSGLSSNMSSGMVETLNLLKNNHYTLATLSDTIPPHVKFLQEGGFFEHFDFPMTSISFRVTKKGLPIEDSDTEIAIRTKKTAAFGCALARLNMPPRACLFIDDKEEYRETAYSLGIQTIQYKLPEPLERLKEKLQQAGVKM